MRVLGISGSLRADSHNTRLLKAAADQLPPGAQFESWNRLGELPHYNQELDGDATPASVRELRDAVASADAVLIATPEYNSSIPGVLKNALDWLSRPAGQSVLRNKPVEVLGASTGMFGAVWAQAETRKVLSAIGARVVDAEFPLVRAGDAWDGHDRLLDDRTAEGLRTHVALLVDAIRERAAVTETALRA